MIREELKQKILMAKRSQSMSFGEENAGDLFEIRKYYQKTFHDSFDLHCHRCVAKAVFRLADHLERHG